MCTVVQLLALNVTVITSRTFSAGEGIAVLIAALVGSDELKEGRLQV